MDAAIERAMFGSPQADPPSRRGFAAALATKYYDDFHLQNGCPVTYTAPIATEMWNQPISFMLDCYNEGDPYPGCKLHPALISGTFYYVIWTGQLLVPQEGVYTLTIANVDNRAQVEIETDQWYTVTQHWCGALSGGEGNAYTGTIVLSAGLHNFRVRFVQETLWEASLQVRWQGPGFSEELIWPAWLPPGQCNSPSPACGLNGACAGIHFWFGGDINSADGNHVYQVEDMGVPIVGGALKFERVYASQDITATALSYGWTHNYDMHLVFPDDPGGEERAILVTAPDGSRLRFLDQGDGAYSPYPGVQARLVSQTNGLYGLTGSDEISYYFYSDGYLFAIQDPQDHQTTLSYTDTESSSRLLDRVTGPGGERFLQFVYNDQAKLVGVQDDTARQISYSYNQDGDLAIVTDTRGFTWTYTYTGNHFLHEVRDANGNLVEKTDYDDQGRAVRQWVGDATEPTWEIAFVDGSTRVITDGLGNAQTVTYDDGLTWTGSEDAAGNAITRSYDAHFNLNYFVDANRNATAIEWSACGCRPTAITDALSNTIRMLYDGHNNLISTTDALNRTTRYEYDYRNLLISMTNALTQTTYYTYSLNFGNIPNGLLLETLAPGDRRTRYQYDSYGQLLSTAAFSGGQWITTTTYAYRCVGLSSAAFPAS
jgi:YD repeat-containing protein